MKKYFVFSLLLLCLLFSSSCSNSRVKWYNPKEMSSFGVSKTDALAAFKMKEEDLIDTGLADAGIWQVQRTVSIEGLNFNVYLGFDISNENEPFTKIIYEYISDASGIDESFAALKNMAKTLTKKYDYPYTEAIYHYEDIKNTIASVTNLNDAEAPKEYKDIWMTGSRMKSGIYKDKRTMCTLNFNYVPESGSITTLTFTIKGDYVIQ